MVWSKRKFFGLVTAAFAACVLAVRNDDEAVAELMEKWQGISLVTWSIDATTESICTTGVAGERIKGSGQPITLTGDSRHHVGSVTKSMTTVLLATLVEEGRLPNGWDTHLREIFTEDDGGNYGGVTLRQLVSMQSGIPNMPEDMSIVNVDPRLIFRLGGWMAALFGAPLDPKTYRRAIALTALYTAPQNAPGETYYYSNWSYLVAGHIVEKYLGVMWEDALRSRIFEPLGIYFGNDPLEYLGAPVGAGHPWGHRGDEQTPCDPSSGTCDFPTVTAPAGAVSAPVAAMARYFAWQIQCHNGELPPEDPANNILTQESCQLLHQPADPQISVYGYGWRCFEDSRLGSLCSHSGTNGLNYYNVTLSFDMKRAFVSFTNAYRPTEWEDEKMGDEAVAQLFRGEQPECLGGDRFSSSAVTEASP